MGEAEHSLRAEVLLVATTREKKPWARPPIGLQFQVRSNSCICVCKVAMCVFGHHVVVCVTNLDTCSYL